MLILRMRVLTLVPAEEDMVVAGILVVLFLTLLDYRSLEANCSMLMDDRRG